MSLTIGLRGCARWSTASPRPLLTSSARHMSTQTPHRPTIRPQHHTFSPRQAKRTLFGVGAPLTWATISACKTLLWSTIGINVAVWGAWNYAKGTDPLSGSSGPAYKAYGSASNRQSASLKRQTENTLEQNFLLRPSDLQKGKYWTLITSAFSHQALYHLAGNMFTIHAFGSVLAFAGVPPLALGVLMAGSAIGGSLGFLAQHGGLEVGKKKQNSWFGGRVEHAALGASGMAMGMGAAAALLAPTSQMLMFGVVPLPMW